MVGKFKYLGALSTLIVNIFVLISRCTSAFALPTLLPRNPPQLQNISIKFIHVYSEIQLTHGITFIKSQIVNNDAQLGNCAEFDLLLPSEAFIRNFTILSNGQLLTSNIRSLGDSSTQNSSRLTIGIVQQVDVSRNEYKISIMLEPSQSLTVTLIYEEQLQLLARVNSLTYQYRLDLKSDLMPVVEDFRVVVTIQEPNMIQHPIVPNMRSRRDPRKVFRLSTSNLRIQTVTENTTRISWFPDTEEKARFIRENCLGQFVLEYSIESRAGEILVGSGYIFREGIRLHEPAAPTQLAGPESISSKHIVFVLDISGSMEGLKLNYTRTGMTKILQMLPSQDYFSLVTFSSKVHVWQALTNSPPVPVPAIAEFKTNAINFIDNLRVHGSTNIFGALVKGLSIAQAWNGTSLIFFMTDGEPTTGLVSHAEIFRRIAKFNSRHGIQARIPIFTLAFGAEADEALCEQISEQNSGFSRQIFENMHSATDLVEFYTDIMRATQKRESAFEFKHFTDTRGAKYYEWKDKMFQILFRAENNSASDRRPAEGVGYLHSEFTDAVAALKIEANPEQEPGTDDCAPEHPCLAKLSPGTAFRLKLFLKLEFQDESQKIGRNRSEICEFLGNFDDSLRVNSSNTSLARLIRNTRSSKQFQLVTPCTSLFIES